MKEKDRNTSCIQECERGERERARKKEGERKRKEERKMEKETLN